MNRRWKSMVAAAAVAATVAGLANALVAEAAAGCRVDYAVGSNWPGGFGVNVTITNLGDALNGWRLAWTFRAGQTITQLWNGTLSAVRGRRERRQRGLERRPRDRRDRQFRVQRQSQRLEQPGAGLVHPERHGVHRRRRRHHDHHHLRHDHVRHDHVVHVRHDHHLVDLRHVVDHHDLQHLDHHRDLRRRVEHHRVAGGAGSSTCRTSSAGRTSCCDRANSSWKRVHAAGQRHARRRRVGGERVHRAAEPYRHVPRPQVARAGRDPRAEHADRRQRTSAAPRPVRRDAAPVRWWHDADRLRAGRHRRSWWSTSPAPTRPAPDRAGEAVEQPEPDRGPRPVRWRRCRRPGPTTRRPAASGKTFGAMAGHQRGRAQRDGLDPGLTDRAGELPAQQQRLVPGHHGRTDLDRRRPGRHRQDACSAPT